MISLDTNHLIRFFTNDVKELAIIVKKVIEEEKGIFIPTISVAETVYVLGQDYKKSKGEICTQVELLLS